MPFLTIISYIIQIVKLRTSCPKLVRSGVFRYARRGRENWFVMMWEECVGREGCGLAFKIDRSICDSRSGESDRRGRARGVGGVGGCFGKCGWMGHIVAFNRKICIYRSDREIRAESPATGPLKSPLLLYHSPHDLSIPNFNKKSLDFL